MVFGDGGVDGANDRRDKGVVFKGNQSGDSRSSGRTDFVNQIPGSVVRFHNHSGAAVNSLGGNPGGKVFGQAVFDGGSRQRVYKEAGISRRAPGDSGKDTKIFFGNLPSFAKGAKDTEYGVNLFFGNPRVSRKPLPLLRRPGH